MAKVAEENALPIAIGGLVVILLAGIGLAFWWKRSSDVQESDAEQMPAPRRYHTQKLMSARSGPYSIINQTFVMQKRVFTGADFIILAHMFFFPSLLSSTYFEAYTAHGKSLT